MATTSSPQIQHAHLPRSAAEPSASPQTSGLRMSALILSRDQEAIRSFHPVLASAGSRLQFCTDPELALEMLERWRFDAVVVDCDAIPLAMDVLRYLRKSPSNRTSVAFALVERTSASIAFAAGASFVLNKPVTREQVRAILRAARGVILLGSRRYYRRPLVTPVTFVNSSCQALQLWTVNISEGGLKLQGPRAPSQGERGTVTLKLPETEESIIAGVEVVWANPQEAGLRFTNIVDGGRAILCGWISKSFEQELAAMKPASQNC